MMTGDTGLLKELWGNVQTGEGRFPFGLAEMKLMKSTPLDEV
jgi:hypothetical protein